MLKRRIHLTFQGQLADEPAIWTLSQDFNLVFNIRQPDLAGSRSAAWKGGGSNLAE